MKTPAPAPAATPELEAAVAAPATETDAPGEPRLQSVTFHRAYDHTWPSRAMTAYPVGWSGKVKASVVEAAVPDYATLDAGEDS